MEAILNRLRWSVLLWGPRLGFLGWCAIGIIVLGILAALGETLPAHYQIARMQSQLADLETHKPRAERRRHPDETPVQQLAAFAALLGTSRDIPHVISEMRRLAEANGIVLEQGEFKLVLEEGDPIARYQIILPMKAEYHSTREFVRAVLQDLPAVALDELSFRRDDANTPLLETRVRFTLYLKSRDPGETS